MSAPAGHIEVVPAEGRKRFRDFLHLPYAIYEGDPNWVAPLLRDVKTAFNKKKHPFHLHSEVQPFVAYRDGRPVGRIAAINNRNPVYMTRRASPVCRWCARPCAARQGRSES